MKYVHPDIEMGEPIPEIEPRVCTERLELSRLLIQWCGWCFWISFVLMVGMLFFEPGLFVRVMIFVAFLVLWISPVFRHKHLRAVLGRFKDHEDWHGWNIPFKENALQQASFLIMMFLGQGLVGGLDGVSSMFTCFGMTALMCGLGLLVVMPIARQPGQVSCEECSYPLVGLTLPCKCPECGGWILHPNYTTDCPRIRSPWFLRGGLGLAVLGLATLYTGFARPGMIYSAIPGGVLRAMAVGDDEAFEQLTQSKMTAEQRASLIESLVTNQTRGRNRYRQSRWLGECFKAGELSNTQIDAIMGTRPAIQIQMPDSARVGERFEISLRSSDDDLPSAFRPVYYFAGFRVGDETELHAGSDHPRKWRYLYKDLYRADTIEEDPNNRPFYTLTPGEAGALVVRCRVVIVLTDWKRLDELSWGAGGEPVFESPPHWSRVFDLERMIEVVE